MGHRQVEATPFITDRNVEHSGRGSNLYSLVLQFKNEDGEPIIYLRKDVKPSEYHINDSQITIHYSKGNP
ncbi:hypothetical protein [Virgibacillus pantothenticus]|uniref:hypothetical protein n=1 Tax=Virgibacillus pantothenticus TaxID=1473 RepID=UPI0009868FFD|nr:hypothetical protein [Virgibacillus pantothenticus]